LLPGISASEKIRCELRGDFSNTRPPTDFAFGSSNKYKQAIFHATRRAQKYSFYAKVFWCLVFRTTLALRFSFPGCLIVYLPTRKPVLIIIISSFRHQIFLVCCEMTW
jgi:hypothetical protein